RERVSALAPDLVVLAVYVGNDLNDLAFGAVDARRIDEDAGQVGPLRAPLSWLALHSHLLQVVGPPLQRALEAPLARLGVSVGPPPPPTGMDNLIRLMRECHGCWFQAYKQASRVRTNPDAIEQAHRRLALLFEVMDAQVRARGSRLAI